MEELVELIRKKKKNGKTVFVCGNGGSAATAEHFANDLFSKDVRAFCLNSNTAIVTMIANDFGYPFVFSKQLNLYADKGDLLITISCSGISPNIINAQAIAKLRKLDIYEFEKFTKGKPRDYGILEDKHLAMAHAVSKEL